MADNNNDKRPAEAPPQDENQLIAERRAKLAALREGGQAFPNDYRRDSLAGELHAAFADRDAAWLEANPTRVNVGGSMLFKRIMGKASFAKIADRTGQVQLFLQQDPLGDELVLIARGGLGRLGILSALRVVDFVCHSSFAAYTPALRDASRNWSRSPSSTAVVLPTSTPVRRSLMRD